MPYTFKLDTDDVILNTWQERDRLHVALYVREGDDGQGPTVVEWWDQDAEQAFEDGFLKRSRLPGPLKDNDSALLQSALDYAVERELSSVTGFVGDVCAKVDALALTLPEAYDRYIAEQGDAVEEEDDVSYWTETFVEKALAGDKTLPKVSDKRLEDIASYLQETLEQALAARQAPAPKV